MIRVDYILLGMKAMDLIEHVEVGGQSSETITFPGRAN
jgi:hypothetical protein